MDNYGFDTTSYEAVGAGSAPVGNVVLYLDMAKVFEVYTQAMKTAFQMGRQARTDELSLAPNQNVTTPPLPLASPAGSYLGAYDRFAYGVYDDEEKYGSSVRFWDPATLSTCAFSNRDEALAYARNGVAGYKGVPVESIPPMLRRMNWRQQV